MRACVRVCGTSYLVVKSACLILERLQNSYFALSIYFPHIVYCGCNEVDCNLCVL